MAHDEVPAEGDGVLVGPHCVVLRQAVLQEPLRAQVCLRLPDSAEYYQGNLQIVISKCFLLKFVHYLQAEDDDQEYAISRQEDSGLLDTTAVAEEGDDEDEGSESNKQVSCLVNDGRLNKLLQQSGGILLLRGTERAGVSSNVDVEVYEGFFADSYPGADHENSGRNHLQPRRL